MGIKKVLPWRKILVCHLFSNVIQRMNLFALWNNMKKTVGFKTTLLFEKYIQSYLIPKKPIFRGFIGGIPKNRILTTSNKDEKQHKTTKKRQFTP